MPPRRNLNSRIIRRSMTLSHIALIIMLAVELSVVGLFPSPPRMTEASVNVDVTEVEQSAYLLVMLLDSARLVVDRNQTLINDRQLGEKGFTPEVFESQVIEELRMRTGVDMRSFGEASVPSLARRLLPILMQVSKETVASAQLVINQRGIAYKNFIPANFARLAASRFSAKSHIILKQVALHPRNPKNTPDFYEETVLGRWMNQPGPVQPQSESLEAAETGKIFRMMVPLYYEKHCLECHGTPAGILDISGYPREGSREGDLAGAISVLIPVSRLTEAPDRVLK
jgi:Protein of unknown function (DUF3365)